MDPYIGIGMTTSKIKSENWFEDGGIRYFSDATMYEC